jgi:hypothetical protein
MSRKTCKHKTRKTCRHKTRKHNLPEGFIDYPKFKGPYAKFLKKHYDKEFLKAKKDILRRSVPAVALTEDQKKNILHRVEYMADKEAMKKIGHMYRNYRPKSKK